MAVKEDFGIIYYKGFPVVLIKHCTYSPKRFDLRRFQYKNKKYFNSNPSSFSDTKRINKISMNESSAYSMCWDIEIKFHKNLHNQRNDQVSSLQRSLKVLFLCRFRCNQHTITIPFTRKQSRWRYRENRYKYVWWVKIPTQFSSSQTVWVFPLWRWPILE